MNQLKITLQDTFNQFWEARQGRERRFLSIAALVVLLTLVYLVAIDPALSGSGALRKSLPVLHQQVAQMQQMSQAIAAIPPLENRPDVNRELVETAFTNSGLKAQTLSVNDGIVRAQINSTSMSSLQTCLLDLQRTGGLFVDEMKITGLEAGMISATFTLRQAVPAAS
jgi:general secretion pathway protein M